jgi:hypothetical protein
MRSEDLVGAWRELGRENVSGDGSVKPDVPRLSQILYSADGHMGVVNVPKARAPLAQPASAVNLDGVSVEERAQAAVGVVAYAGRYEVEGDIVRHIIYTSLNPNLIGTTQLRRATLAGDELTLSTLPDARGDFFRIRWRRATKV